MKISEAVYNSLLALGFHEKLSPFDKAALSKDVFKNMTTVVGEQMLHLLFSKIDPKLAKDAFRECWPINNLTTRAKFQRICYDWLKKLSQDNHFVLELRSLTSREIVNPKSKKPNQFLETIYSLCQIVLQLEIESMGKNVLEFPRLQGKGNAVGIATISTQKNFHCQCYMEEVPCRKDVSNTLLSKSKELINQYHKLLDEKDEISKEWNSTICKSKYLTEIDKEELSSCSMETFTNKLEMQIKEKNQEILDMWEELHFLKKSDADCWAKVSAFIEGSRNSSGLDGNILTAGVSEAQKSGWLSDGKLDLKKLLEAFIESLKLIKGSARNAGKRDLSVIEKQSECIKSLTVNWTEVRLSLSQSRSRLLSSIDASAKSVRGSSPLDLIPAYKDSFHLLPPPLLESTSMSKSKIDCSFLHFPTLDSSDNFDLTSHYQNSEDFSSKSKKKSTDQKEDIKATPSRYNNAFPLDSQFPNSRLHSFMHESGFHSLERSASEEMNSEQTIESVNSRSMNSELTSVYHSLSLSNAASNADEFTRESKGCFSEKDSAVHSINGKTSSNYHSLSLSNASKADEFTRESKSSSENKSVFTELRSFADTTESTQNIPLTEVTESNMTYSDFLSRIESSLQTV